jgi:hypothetical protein
MTLSCSGLAVSATYSGEGFARSLLESRGAEMLAIFNHALTHAAAHSPSRVPQFTELPDSHPHPSFHSIAVYQAAAARLAESVNAEAEAHARHV